MPTELKKGLSGAAIRKLHQDLNKLGLHIDKAEYKAGVFGPDTEAKIKAVQTKFNLPVTGILDAQTSARFTAALSAGTSVAEASVKGQVSTEESRPAAGYKVTLLSKTLRGLKELASGACDAKGAYSITYSYPGRFDLLIRLSAPNGAQFDSEVFFNIPPQLEHNLVFGGGRYIGLSEFEQWMLLVNEKLKGEGVLLEDLVENQRQGDITYLAGATGISVQKIMFLVLARRLEKFKNIPAGVTFAFFRQKQPGDLPVDLLGESQEMGMGVLSDYLFYRILAIPPDVQRDTLLAAAAVNQLPLKRVLPTGNDPAGKPWTEESYLAAQVEALVQNLQQLETAEALNLPFIVGTTPLKDLLKLAGLNPPKQKQIAEILVKFEDPLRDFWASSQAKNILNPQEIKNTANVLELGAMVKNHLPVLEALKKRMDTEPAKFDAVGDFVSLTEVDFEALLTSIHTASKPAFPEHIKQDGMSDAAAIKVFAKVIDANFETNYYTLAVAKKLATEADFKLVFPGENPPKEYRSQVAAYIEANPILDLRQDNIQAFMDANAAPAEKEKIKFFLKMLQRVARLTANKETLKFLINNNLTNARRIYRMGKEAFLQKFAESADASTSTGSLKLPRFEAEQVFHFAEKAYATALATFTQFNSSFNSVIPAALGDYGKTVEVIKNDSQFKKFPDLEKLFGSTDFCAADPDQSVLSPAAYFVDMLHFLTERKDAANNPLVNLLLKRRPDLENIEFNRDNTRTPLPYIDLVNELLESVAQQSVFQGFQTVGTAENLAAQPTNEDPAAYNKLADATNYPKKIPFGLPFHRWHRESEAFLQHLQIPRDELVELKNPALSDAVKKSVAAFYFGLSLAETELICDAQNTATRQKKLWGVSDLASLNTVKVFLDNSGLSYSEMEELLALKFVNGGTPILVDNMEACDTAKRLLKTLVQSTSDTAKIEAANRFIRLWRKLGWSMADLHLTIQAPAIGAGKLDVAFLYKLRDFERVRRELNLSVADLVRFYEAPERDRSLALLAAALQTPVADLQNFIALKDAINPFAGPKQTYEFVGLFKKMVSSGIDAPGWVFLTSFSASSPLALSDSVIAEGIANMKATLPTPANDTELIQALSDLFAWEAGAAGKMLKTLSTNTNPLLQVFKTNLAKPNAVQELTGSLQLLQKLFYIKEGLRLSVKELDWLLAVPRLVVLNSLPIKTGAATASILPWIEIVDGIALNKYFKAQDQLTFIGLLSNAGGTPDELWFSQLETLTGWPAETVKNINTAFGFNDFTKASYFQKLGQIRQWLKAANVAPARLAEWAKISDINQTDALNIKTAVQARYDEKKWREVNKSIQDILREQKRDALVAYILNNIADSTNQWQTTDDLYAHFLLDVEMSACQPTSRIVQANAAVQLFVQRCFMNLEAGVKVNPDQEPEWKQWKWMKNYRVWEANRNVFLYPENWIEPELRSDKTPFFQELEEELNQNEVTAEYVETVFLNYLEKLEQVARLDVCGMYEHQTGSDTTHHVIGRTKAHPQQYYYRKLLNGDRWTAWEKIEADIQAEQVMPFIFNNKLYVFWPVFSAEPVPMKDTDLPQVKGGEITTSPKAEPEKFWKVQLAWTVYRNGKWQAKQLSKEVLPLVHFRPEFSYHFKTTIDAAAGRVFFHVYFSESNFYRKSPASPAGRPLRHTCDIEFNGISFKTYKVDTSGSEKLGEIGRLVQNMPRLAHPDFRLPAGLRPKNNELINNQVNASQPVYVKTAEAARIDDGVLLKKATPPFSLLIPHQDDQFDPSKPFFFKDGDRTFFVKPSAKFKHPLYGYKAVNFFSKAATQLSPRLFNTVGGLGSGNTAVVNAVRGLRNTVSADMRSINLLTNAIPVVEVVRAYEPRFAQLQYQITYAFTSFYHPMIDQLLIETASKGIEGLMARKTQLSKTSFDFNKEYGDNSSVTNKPVETIDFDLEGPYAQYNWELFFHIPYLIAKKLSQNQRFEEALQWYSYIFNPTNIETDVPAPQRYWVTKKFHQTTLEEYLKQQINQLLLTVSQTDSALEKQVEEWRKNPFNPHLIAQYRTVAYQKNIVMRFIDNLLDWADSLFKRDSFETVNEATQLYVMAGLLLGRRPRIIPAEKSPTLNFKLIKSSLDEFSNVLVETENYINSENAATTQVSSEALPDLLRAGAGEKLLFGIPHNEYLLRYWDKLADRLYKIRHCLDFEGRFRILDLFAPPIDPALLVRAGASGLDLSTALDDSAIALSPYRFNIVWSKAMDLCNDVKNLGNALLSALEKKDAEGLSLLRSDQEIRLLEMVADVRRKQIQEAELQLKSLEQSRELIHIRRDYYKGQDFMNALEITAFSLSSASTILGLSAVGGNALSGVLALIPNFIAGAAGFGGSPHTVVDSGGKQASESSKKLADSLATNAAVLDKLSSLAATMGSYQRRQEEWNHQVALADQELKQMETQLAAAKIRLAIAEQELQNHELQVEHAKTTDAYLRTKYTNQQLYNWMIGQLSSVYFQTYKLAYDMARKAEKSYRFELGLEDTETSFIRFGYWDSLKKGLLAGEKLGFDLKRMDSAFLDQNVRHLELTKHLSLAQIAPQALLDLKNKGICTLTLPEWLFDLDFPGHYLRRIKSVSLSIPCIAGPYTSINASLRLQNSKIRFKPQAGEANLKTVAFGKNTIATSSAQNDGGVFELNFRDERYLPFEGAGVVESQWEIEMPRDHNQFDFETISDVILHLRYTAKEESGPFKEAAKTDALKKVLANGVLVVNLRQEFSTEWHQFLHNEQGEQILQVDLKNRLPFIARGKNVKVTEVAFTCLSANPTETYTLKVDPFSTETINLVKSNAQTEVYLTGKTSNASPKTLAPLKLKFSKGNGQRLAPDELKEIFLLLKMEMSK